MAAWLPDRGGPPGQGQRDTVAISLSEPIPCLRRFSAVLPYLRLVEGYS